MGSTCGHIACNKTIYLWKPSKNKKVQTISFFLFSRMLFGASLSGAPDHILHSADTYHINFLDEYFQYFCSQNFFLINVALQNLVLHQAPVKIPKNGVVKYVERSLQVWTASCSCNCEVYVGFSNELFNSHKQLRPMASSQQGSKLLFDWIVGF